MLSQRFDYTITPFKHIINDAGYFQLNDKNDAEKAVALFESNIKNFPDCSYCYDSLADGYEKLGRISDAVKQMDLALKYSDRSDEDFAVYVEHKERLVALVQEGD